MSDGQRRNDMASEVEDQHRITRDAILGYIVSEHEDGTVSVSKITMDWTGWEQAPDLSTAAILEDQGWRIVGVIPAAPGSFQVFGGVGAHGRTRRLGVEIPGLEHPDWEQERLKSDGLDDGHDG